MHQGIAGVLFRGKVMGLIDCRSMYYVVRPTIMQTTRRAYYEIDADGMYQSHSHCAALFYGVALEKLLYSELPVLQKRRPQPPLKRIRRGP